MTRHEAELEVTALIESVPAPWPPPERFRGPSARAELIVEPWSWRLDVDLTHSLGPSSSSHEREFCFLSQALR